jgi:hypothetical protein
MYGFRPAPEVLEWIKAVFLSPEGPLHNPEHVHLNDAHIGVLWAGVLNVRNGRQVLGQAEMPRPQGNRWVKARQEQQLEEWFGDIPDFLITLDAAYCADCSDIEFAALVEHELYHCGQQRNEFGIPVFNRDTGLPKFTIRGHDVEEFVGIVRRYGKGAPEGDLAKLVEAANRTPEVARIDIARACGTCQLKAV